MTTIDAETDLTRAPTPAVPFALISQFEVTLGVRISISIRTLEDHGNGILRPLCQVPLGDIGTDLADSVNPLQLLVEQLPHIVGYRIENQGLVSLPFETDLSAGSEEVGRGE